MLARNSSAVANAVLPDTDGSHAKNSLRGYDKGTKATFAGSEYHDKCEAAIKTSAPAPDAFSQGLIDTLRAKGGTLQAEKWLTVSREYKYAGYGTPTYLRTIADIGG